MENLTSNEYWTEIKSIAANLVDESMEQATLDNNGDTSDFESLKETAEESINDYRLHEVIDGHQWVIYYAYNLDVISHSDNEDYMVDNFGSEYAGQIVADKGIDDLHTAIAFWCMYADVQDDLSDAFDEYEQKDIAA